MMKKYKGLILYGVFGVLTTLVNIITYFICAQILHISVVNSTIISWLIAVIFAFITNKIWVFESKTKNYQEVIKEIFSFFSCRILTGILDVLIMYIFVTKLNFNDLIIKVISNVIVIVINYVASKLIIFNKQKKPGKEINYAHLLTIVIIFLLAFLFVMQSQLNFFEKGESLTDSSVFRYMALIMSKNYMPYLDFFDHKGPIIYIINYLGFIINKDWGIWLIELGCCFFSFYLIYKIAHLFTSKIPSLLILLLSTLNLFSYFEQGNFVEEYALLFILISFYIFIDYLKNNKVNTMRLIVCGMCFMAVSLLRVNMIPCFIVYCLAIFIMLIKNKKPQELKRCIINFLLGCAIIFIPIIIWLIMNHSFTAFINDYILFNLKYTKAMGIGSKLMTFTYFINTTIMLLSIFTNLYALKKEEQKNIYLLNLIFIVVSLLLASTSGRTYPHYGMILIPTYIIPLTYLLNLILNLKNKELSTIIIIGIICFLIAPPWLDTLNNLGDALNKRKSQNITADVLKVNELIQSNTTINDKISVYGNWDYMYYYANRLSASKYSYQYPIGEVNSQILNEYFKDLEREKPKIIVIAKNAKNVEKMKNFVYKNNYYEILNKNNEVYVYKLRT